jgi:uncharacterized membrane protein (UPF0136 family)
MTLYGVIVIFAGLIGFFTSSSLVSLVSSAIFGALALLVGYGLKQQTTWAKSLGLFTTGILGVFFMWRVVQGSPFPALAIVGLSLIGLAMLLENKR